MITMMEVVMTMMIMIMIKSCYLKKHFRPLFLLSFFLLELLVKKIPFITAGQLILAISCNGLFTII